MAEPPGLQLSVVGDPGKVHFDDAVLAAWSPDGSYFVSTPNATFIPEIVQGLITVCLRDDGSFGKHDPSHWPQLFVWQHPYLATVPKRPTSTLDTLTNPCPHLAIWTQPTPDDFVPLPNAPAFGRLRPEFLDALQPLVSKISSDVSNYVLPPLTAVDKTTLRRFEVEMAMAWERLLRTSATFRDQLLQVCIVRRYWLLCSGFMTFYDLLGRERGTDPLPFKGDVMGAWTSEPRVVQMLFSLGVPVWMVRSNRLVPSDIRVSKLAAMSTTHTICDVKFHGAEPAYQGLVGVRHLEITFMAGELMCLSGGDRDPCGYRDLAVLPTASISDPNEYVPFSQSSRPPLRGWRSLEWKARAFASSSQVNQARYRPLPYQRVAYEQKPRAVASSSQFSQARYRPLPSERVAHSRDRKTHPSQVRGRDKFVDVSHPWMPPLLASWAQAMQTVDRSDKARPGKWGYWIPEPGLLLGPKDPARMQTYVMNWLRAWPIWLYVLQLPGSMAKKQRTQVWRDFLNGVREDPKFTTKCGKRAYEIKQVFARVFSEHGLEPATSGEAEWLGHHVQEVDDRIGPLVIWETFELGFRHELSALDHALRCADTPAQEADRLTQLARVFPCNGLYTVHNLPTPDSQSLVAPLPHHRIPSLNALREILMRWPLCPPQIKKGGPLLTTSSVEAIEYLESQMASFYTQTFFDVAGRAPIVPHCYPSPVL